MEEGRKEGRKEGKKERERERAQFTRVRVSRVMLELTKVGKKTGSFSKAKVTTCWLVGWGWGERQEN